MLPTPATTRWSSSTALRQRSVSAERVAPVRRVEVERLRPQAAVVEERAPAPPRRRSSVALPKRRMSRKRSCSAVVQVERSGACGPRPARPASTTVNWPVMPRWIDEARARRPGPGRSTCRGGAPPRRAGRPAAPTHAFDHGRRRACSLTRTAVRRRPISSGRRSRTTVSTSGSSGTDGLPNAAVIIGEIGKAHHTGSASVDSSFRETMNRLLACAANCCT